MSLDLVYRFSADVTDGRGDMKGLLGGKGAGLAEMSRIGVVVPPGFTISTKAFMRFREHGGLPPELEAEVREALAWLEKLTQKSFGGSEQPLLVSVRSGARVSMPGMMDTVLNLGLNRDTVEALSARTGNRRFALDSYRRFIQMYANVVMGVDSDEFERALEIKRDALGVQVDSEISEQGLTELIDEFLEIVDNEANAPFPEVVWDQLWGAIRAVFESWDNQRARFYRKLNGIPDDWGTAVNVQSMVFGNMGPDSGTGVCFSRNPSDGTKRPYGEFLRNAQGEDVVAGIRTPQPVAGADQSDSMERTWPEVYQQLCGMIDVLEHHFGDMQDIEFTVEQGQLFILQTRSGKRTSQASLKIALDLCSEGVVDRAAAVNSVDPNSIMQLLASEFDLEVKEEHLAHGALLGKGLNAGPGAATGVVVLSAQKAVEFKEDGKNVILVRAETSPEDIAGMHAARGILTQRGGMTSHAAVVARGMGKPCVVGCTSMKVDYREAVVWFGDRKVREGQAISIDGTTGEVILGEVPTRPSSLIRFLGETRSEPDEQARMFLTLMEWADEFRRLGVRTNADTPRDARLARALGAQGIGLCRTEHMFFGDDRIRSIRKMILASDEDTRRKALHELLPMQQQDFYEILKAMQGFPVTIRLLDPPLHEFLPHDDEQIEALVADMGTTESLVRQRIRQLHEVNPMLGHRGCRLGISLPEIYQMQVNAILGATTQARNEGVDVRPEIMVPLITCKAELDAVVNFIKPLIQQSGLNDIPIGTMIEIPRAALTADEIAQTAQFFSFGTNDLTQCGLGISRDDCGSFLPQYLDQNIYEHDPFKTIDQRGIGRMVQIGVKEGKAAREGLHVGVCGEHGGDPASIAFFDQVGLDYVSCSPFRVPIARLAAAQAQIRAEKARD